MAPELQGMGPYIRRNTIAVDMWSLGVIVYELLTSEHPFLVKTCYNTQETGVLTFSGPPIIDSGFLLDFSRGQKELPIGSLRKVQVSHHAISFIQALLVADPKLRMSAADALSHQWLITED